MDILTFHGLIIENRRCLAPYIKPNRPSNANFKNQREWDNYIMYILIFEKAKKNDHVKNKLTCCYAFLILSFFSNLDDLIQRKYLGLSSSEQEVGFICTFYINTKKCTFFYTYIFVLFTWMSYFRRFFIVPIQNDFIVAYNWSILMYTCLPLVI